MAKYNFTGNPDKPGGFEELSMKQGEKLTLLNKGHAPSGNHLWWEVQNDDGKQGFVPANYCMVRVDITGFKNYFKSMFKILNIGNIFFLSQNLQLA